MPSIDIASTKIIRDGTPKSATEPLHVISMIDAPPLRFFREIILLTFTTAGIADRIRIETEATTLKAVFQPYDYDTLGSESPLAASLTSSDRVVIITLDAPRKVHHVALPSDKALEPGCSLEFYRLDGNTPSEKPTTIASLADNVATLLADAEFRDIRFAIRLKDHEGQYQPLSDHEVSELHLRSFPTGSRVGIADPVKLESQDTDDLLSVVFFWQAHGEINEANAALGNMDASEALATALQRYLDDFFTHLAENLDENGHLPPTPQQIEVALVIESDAPCILEITDFNITYHSVLQSLFSTDGKKVEKTILRFSGEQVSSQDVLIQVPRTFTSATLKTVESFPGDGSLAAGDSSDFLSALQAQNEGAYIGVEKWVAQEYIPAPAFSASGIALGLMSLTDRVELLVELQEDWHGKPSGRKLAEGKITLEQIGKRGWATLRFPGAVIISSQPYWILTKAAGGSALWLAEPGDPPVRVLERSSQKNAWTEIAVLDGLQALYRFFSRGREAHKVGPIMLTIGDFEATSSQNGPREFDLASALRDYLKTQPGESTLVTVPLTFTAAVPGIITVYPPCIEYDICENRGRP